MYREICNSVHQTVPRGKLHKMSHHHMHRQSRVVSPFALNYPCPALRRYIRQCICNQCQPTETSSALKVSGRVCEWLVTLALGQA